MNKRPVEKTHHTKNKLTWDKSMMSNKVLTMLSSNTNNFMHQTTKKNSITSIVTVKKKKKGGHSRPNKENTNIKRKVQNTAQKVHNLNVKH